MKIRIARHTKDLVAITAFYHKILELEVLGSFADHAGYDGVFLGYKGENWHLEFTCSDEAPEHKPDGDDLLVFYTKSREEYEQLVHKIKSKGIVEVAPKNPYWKENGRTFLDPDGFGVVISMA